MKMIFFTLNVLIISLFAEKKSIFKAPTVLENENDPDRNTIYGEFFVFFDKDSYTDAKIQEFVGLFKCYTLNEEVTDEFPYITDHWIAMDEIDGCDEPDIEVEWADYFITGVEENELVEATGANQCISRTVESALWNLDSVCPSVSSGISYIQYDASYNPNLDIVVMDSGIDTSHSQFNGITIERIFDAYPDQPALGSHGTHCAGTILGRDYGAFRIESNTQIKLIDVRIFPTDGGASADTVLNGYDSIINYLNNNPGKKVIINMSFGGGNWAEYNTRLAGIRAAGGISFAAAGNSNVDASGASPASSADTITVGASDQSKNKASFSNFGNVVDIWAPGVDIKSAIVGGGSASWAGTSMATPLVAGIAANILANNPNMDFSGIKARLLSWAANDVNDGLGNTNLPRVQATCEEYGGAESNWGVTTNYGGWALFEGGGKWYDCPEGYVLGGFWKNTCQNLYCLEEMKCVRPSGPVISQTCYDHNIWSSFDSAGTVQCNDGYFIRGIWSSGSCDGLYCWEELKCCQYDTNVIAVVGETQTHDWWSCFDGSASHWCNVDDNEYITGFKRSDGHQIYNLEEAKTRKAYRKVGSALGWGVEQNYGSWQLFEGGVGKWYDCPAGYVLGGFWKNTCQNLWCLEEMKCVRPAGNVMTQSCYHENIWSSFDGAGTVECREGFFIRGIWASGNCDGLYCWEELNCCQYDQNQILVDGESYTHDWWSCFDGTNSGWCNVDNNEYITGFMRTSGNSLYNLEEARTRKAYRADGSMAIGGDAIRISAPDDNIRINAPDDNKYVPANINEDFSRKIKGGISIEDKHIFEGIGVLLMINLICFAMYCCKGSNKKKGYKVVKFDSSTDIDIESPEQ